MITPQDAATQLVNALCHAHQVSPIDLGQITVWTDRIDATIWLRNEAGSKYVREDGEPAYRLAVLDYKYAA